MTENANVLPDAANVVGPDPGALPGQPGYQGAATSERLAKALAAKGEGYAEVEPSPVADDSVPPSDGAAL